MEVLRTQVNGSLLTKYINKNVAIKGNVIKTNPNGTSFDVQTGDRQVVTINLKQPLDDMLTGLVEVHGMVQGKGIVSCDYYINFPPELGEKFDLEVDNDLTTLIDIVPNNEWR